MSNVDKLCIFSYRLLVVSPFLNTKCYWCFCFSTTIAIIMQFSSTFFLVSLHLVGGWFLDCILTDLYSWFSHFHFGCWVARGMGWSVNNVIWCGKLLCYTLQAKITTLIGNCDNWWIWLSYMQCFELLSFTKTIERNSNKNCFNSIIKSS